MIQLCLAKNFISLFLRILFLIMCIGQGLYTWLWCLQKPEEGITYPGTGVTGDPELPNMGAVNKLGSSRRAIHPHNHWDIFLTPMYLFLITWSVSNSTYCSQGLSWILAPPVFCSEALKLQAPAMTSSRFYFLGDSIFVTYMANNAPKCLASTKNLKIWFFKWMGE